MLYDPYGYAKAKSSLLECVMRISHIIFFLNPIRKLTRGFKRFLKQLYFNQNNRNIENVSGWES